MKSYGEYKLSGDKEVMDKLDSLLQQFVDQKRMKISGDYIPCYELVD